MMKKHEHRHVLRVEALTQALERATQESMPLEPLRKMQ